MPNSSASPLLKKQPASSIPNDARYTNPSNMVEAIQACCRETNQPVPETEGALVRCALESLASKYGEVALQVWNRSLARKSIAFTLSAVARATTCSTSSPPTAANAASSLVRSKPQCLATCSRNCAPTAKLVRFPKCATSFAGRAMFASFSRKSALAPVNKTGLALRHGFAGSVYCVEHD